MAAALWVLSASFSAGAARDADATLNAFFRQYLDERFEQRPMDATRLGDHRFDGLLDDLSPKARAGWVEHTRKTLEELPQAGGFPDSCPPAGQIDFEIFRHELVEVPLAGGEHAAVRGGPARLQRLHQRQRVPAADAVHAAQGNQHRQLHRAHGADSRRSSPRRGQNLQNPPQVVTETAIRQNRGAIAFLRAGPLRAGRPDAAARRR